MEELKEIITKKIAIYTDLNRVAIMLGRADDIKYYSECIKKLNRMLEII